MKLFRSLFILLALTLLAGTLHAKRPWGVLDDMVEDTSFEIYAIDNLIDKRPIHYAVAKDVTPEEEAIFKNNILKWPAEALRVIQKSGRTQEFQDILPLLQTPLHLQKVSPEQDLDIYFSIPREPACGNSVACFKHPGEEPFSQVVIVAEARNKVKKLSLHEIGHYFGLSDQYDFPSNVPHSEYSSDVSEEGSVMDDNEELTYDDVDGFINLLDLRLAQRRNGQFSARAKKGWKSLNPRSKNMYQNATTINRQRFDSWGMDILDAEVIVRREYENGKVKQETLAFPDSPLHVFAVTEKDQVTRDPQTHLITSVQTSIKAAYGPESVSSVPLLLEKRFTYGAPTTCEGQRCIPISIQEVAHGKRIINRQIFVKADGSLAGDIAVFLSPTRYSAVDFGTNIDFKIENRKITFFFLQKDSDDIKMGGFPGQNEVFRFRGEERETCSLPLPEKCEELKFYYHTLYEAHRDHLMSFYKNFYEPLFVTPQRNQTRRQIAQATRARR